MQLRRRGKLFLRRIPLRQAFKRCYGFAFDGGNRRPARSSLDAIHKNRTGTALAKTASEPWTLQIEVVHEDV